MNNTNAMLNMVSTADYVRLADAYQRLGNAEYADWRDFHIAEVIDKKLRLFDLSKLVQRANHQSKEPQFFRMNLKDTSEFEVNFRDTMEAAEHERIKGLLMQKIFGYGAVKVECRDAKGAVYNLPLDAWHAPDAPNRCSIIESSFYVHGGEKISVLVEPTTLAAWTNGTLKDRKRLEADAKRTGRSKSENKEKIQAVVDAVKIEFPERNKSVKARIVHERLKQMGVEKPDADGLRKYF